jgi:coenzyme F420-reducing hydrogenase beta subunit
VDYCCYSKDADVRSSSSSGGAAFELAKAVLDRGGSVCGGAFSDDYKRVVAFCARSENEYLSRLSKSKYSFCPIPDTRELKDELANGREVIYIGSPCHVRSIKKLLGTVPDNLIFIDFRCRGYSRPDKLERFVNRITDNGARKILSFDCRPNHASQIEVVLSDGCIVRHAVRDFTRDSIAMCKRCRFAHGFLSCADITVGDFWMNKGNAAGYGADFKPESGCNIVTINSERGEELWNRAKHRLNFRKVIQEDA